MGTVICRVKPNRSSPRVFKERDVGRIIGYARQDGANDALLIAYILQAFGLKQFQCLLFKVFDILNTTTFLGALLGLLSGLVTVVKGLKILGTGKRGVITSILQAIVPKKWLSSLAKYLLIMGSLEIILSSVIIFITSLANNVNMFNLAQSICNAETKPLNVPTPEVDVGTTFIDLDRFVEEVKGILDAAEEGRYFD